MAENQNLHGYDFDGFLQPGDGEVTRVITSRTTRALFAGLGLTALLMAALLSNLFLQEVRGLPPGDIEDKVVEYSDRWHELMSNFQLDYPVAMVREQVETWQYVSWDELDCMIGNIVGDISVTEDQGEIPAAGSDCSE